MIDHEVVISGGGPTGLTLAAELALADIDVAIIERRSTQDLVGARAGGLHVRTIEVFDQRGIADRFLTVGQKHPMAITFCKTRLDLTSLPSRHNYFLSLWQQQTERILAKWVEELGVPIYRGRELKIFEQNEATVEMTLVDGSLLRAKYLVGCDGGRSTVRKTAGIEFAGWDATKSWLIAELQFLDEPAWGFDATGAHAIGKLEDGTGMRYMRQETIKQLANTIRLFLRFLRLQRRGLGSPALCLCQYPCFCLWQRALLIVAPFTKTKLQCALPSAMMELMRKKRA